MKIALIDYGMGNLKSIENALAAIGYHNVVVTADARQIEQSDFIILPGVGAFRDAMKNLKSRNLVDILNEQVKVRKKPVLGVCLGMQLLFESSAEGGRIEGLGWIPGSVELMELPDQYRVPHVGWNDLIISPDCETFEGLTADKNFYFVHSYHAVCDSEHVIASFDYGNKMTAAVQYQNVIGMQYHPEKSQNNGLHILKNVFSQAQRYINNA